MHLGHYCTFLLKTHRKLGTLTKDKVICPLALNVSFGSFLIQGLELFLALTDLLFIDLHRAPGFIMDPCFPFWIPCTVHVQKY